MRRIAWFSAPVLWIAAVLPAAAHHGVAGVGAAGLRGPGAPVESASSATLPQGSALAYQMFYLEPGVRFYWDKLSLALGVSRPVWTRLNEENQQQGGEGRERYRLILTGSLLF